MTVVPRDMREWRAPEAADLLVSELLGSFGDNELSPECLDGAQPCLKGGGTEFGVSGDELWGLGTHRDGFGVNRDGFWGVWGQEEWVWGH